MSARPSALGEAPRLLEPHSLDAVEVVDHGTWAAATAPGAEGCIRLSGDEVVWLMGARRVTSSGESVTVPPGSASLVEAMVHAGLLNSGEEPERRKLVLTRQGIEVTGADRPLRFLYRTVLKHVLTPAGTVMCCIIALTGGIALLVQLLQNRPLGSHVLSPLSAAAIIVVLELVATVVHEAAHGTVLVRHGRSVRRAGFGFYWGAPSFYVDASEALLLPRRARIAQAAAGPMSDAMIAGIASWAAWAIGGTVGSVLLLLAVLLWLDIATNLVPFLELDGYWMLADRLDRPQLRREALGAAWQAVLHPLKGITWLAIYGLAGIAVGVALLLGGMTAWWAVVGDLVRSLPGEGPLGWLLLAPVVLPTAASWLALSAQLGLTLREKALSRTAIAVP